MKKNSKLRMSQLTCSELGIKERKKNHKISYKELLNGIFFYVKCIQTVTFVQSFRVYDKMQKRKKQDRARKNKSIQNQQSQQ